MNIEKARNILIETAHISQPKIGDRQGWYYFSMNETYKFYPGSGKIYLWKIDTEFRRNKGKEDWVIYPWREATHHSLFNYEYLIWLYGQTNGS